MIWYQINSDYFSQIVDQKKLSGFNENLNFFKLVQKNLEYIKNLNFNGIWLMPLYIRGELNKKGSGSPYAVKEFKIDEERYGSETDLKNLISMAHKLGLHVITEYVPNHMSPDAPFILENPEVTYRNSDGSFMFDQNWTDTVKLKHKNPLVQEFTQKNLINLVKTFGFDGFRIDMAHCPFYDIDGKPYQGEWDTLFWSKVFDNDFFETTPLILIGEVYDDRNKDFAGYGDSIRLMRNNMSVYDKKIHDILASKLETTEDNIQEKLYKELSFQIAAMSIADNFDYENPPYLRIPSNHDDNPGIKIYGGIKEFLCALAIQIFLNGESMIYAGEEFGLQVKPSITGEDKYDDKGNLTESNKIYFVNDVDLENYQTVLTKLLKIKNSFLHNLPMLQLKIRNNEGNLLSDLIGIAYFNIKESQIFLLISNLHKNSSIQWGHITGFFPSFDNFLSQYSLIHLMEKCNFKDKYSIENMITGESFESRDMNSDLWVSLDALDIQVLKLEKI